MKRILTVTILCCAPLLVAANPIINVAVVYSNDHGLNSSQKYIWANDVQRHLNDAFSGFNYSFEVWVSTTDLPVSTGSQTDLQTVEWMQSNSGLNQTRNSIGSSGADLVLMIGGETLTSVCGRAGVERSPVGTMPPLAVSIDERDHAAYAAIFIKEPDCLRWDIIIPHEVGHLLYAEHQKSSDNNGDITKPSRINHGILSGSNTSIMYKPTTSASVQEWSGSTGMTGNYEDNKTWLNDSSMINTVAAYRPLQPPTAKACPPKIMYCSGNTGVYAITPSINEPYSITRIEMFTRNTPQQSWLPGYDGNFTCPTHGAPSTFFVKFLIHTLWGTAECYDEMIIDLAENPNPCNESGW